MRVRDEWEGPDVPPPTPEAELRDEVRQQVLTDMRPVLRAFYRDHEMPPALTAEHQLKLNTVKKQAGQDWRAGRITEAEYREVMAEVRAQEQRLKGGATDAGADQ
jgi:hypothetical protein